MIHVLWFERTNLISLYVSVPPSSVVIMISSPVTRATLPACLAKMQTPESQAALYSIPVPTSGAWVRNKGTACRCIFAPIKARFASSFSKNGIIEVPTETTSRGDTSMKSTRSRATSKTASPWRQATRSLTKVPSSANGSLAWAIIYCSSSSAVM